MRFFSTTASTSSTTGPTHPSSSPEPALVRDDAPGPSNSQTRNRPRVSDISGSDPAKRYETILRDEEAYQAKQYPTFEEVPGCMQLFDEFLMCYALMPQLRSFYRFAEFRDCTWKFRDFKYCLSLKSEPEDARRALWIKRRAEWWARRRVGGSSEDVWEMRREPLVNFPPLHPEEGDEIPGSPAEGDSR